MVNRKVSDVFLTIFVLGGWVEGVYNSLSHFGLISIHVNVLDTRLSTVEAYMKKHASFGLRQCSLIFLLLRFHLEKCDE